MNVDNVITLNDDINCLLLDKANFQGNIYFLAVVLDENEEPTDDTVVLKEIDKPDGTYVLKEDNDFILSQVLGMFTKSLNSFVNNMHESDI